VSLSAPQQNMIYIVRTNEFLMPAPLLAGLSWWIARYQPHQIPSNEALKQASNLHLKIETLGNLDSQNQSLNPHLNKKTRKDDMDLPPRGKSLKKQDQTHPVFQFLPTAVQTRCPKLQL
jgi:hypothetical protein